jgi:hypothetical protein
MLFSVYSTRPPKFKLRHDPYLSVVGCTPSAPRGRRYPEFFLKEQGISRWKTGHSVWDEYFTKRVRNCGLIAALSCPLVPPPMEDFMCWEIDYKFFSEQKMAQETRTKQEQRRVIDQLLNDANKQSEKTNVEGTPVKEVAPAK